MDNPHYELPIDTLNMSELVIQFRIMKALGYHSLFDPNFRRELRNPLRKNLYYRVIMAEAMLSQDAEYKLSKSLVDRLSFFVNPELYKKFREREELTELQNDETHRKKVAELEDQYAQAINRYTPPTAEEQVKIREVLAH